MIGHMPAGYVVSKLLLPRFAACGLDPKWFLCAGILGAVAPDLDMFYFHLIDHQQHHHHTYVTHFPILWGSLMLASAIWLMLARDRKWPALAAVSSLNGMIHMLLDSIVGDIWWLAPFVDRPFALFAVPALYKPWWLNFVLHWSFALEVGLVIWAVCLWRLGSATAVGTVQTSTKIQWRIWRV
jgi:hypothetical protein